MIQRSHGKRLTLFLIFSLLWDNEPYTARHRVSRHGLTASQAPPRRLLVKYRWNRRTTQCVTVSSALEGGGNDVKNIPTFSSGVLLGGCRLPPLKLSTLPWQGLRRWFRTTIFGTYGDCAVGSLNKRARGLCWDFMRRDF